MPILLTTPFNPGELDSKTYPEAKIVEFRIGIEHRKHITIFVEYGQTVEGSWVRGKMGLQTVILEDGREETPYTDAIVANPELYNDMAAALYDIVSTQVPRMAGVVQ